MAKRYQVVTDVASGTAASKAEAKEQAIAMSTMIGCGPAAEQAILPDRYPSDELADKLTCDAEFDEALAIEQELRDVVNEFTSVFGKK